MLRNRSRQTPAETQEALAQSLRANVAFEHSVVSVIAGAMLCAAFSLVLQFSLMLMNGALSTGIFLNILLDVLIISALFFLIGFAASALFITPLFRALEVAKRRDARPYIAAAIGISVLSLIAASVMPSVRVGLSQIAPVIIASVASALIFARRMGPFWARAIAEEAGAEGPLRLH